MDDAARVLDEAEALTPPSKGIVDFRGLLQADSSALAIIIALKRRAVAEGRSLTLVTPEDFRRHKCTINSQLHTKNRLEYSCLVPKYGVTLTARYFLVNEHALGCIVTLSTTSSKPLPITCYLIHLHTHNPHTSRLWEHGLYALQDRERGYGMLGLASGIGFGVAEGLMYSARM